MNGKMMILYKVVSEDRLEDNALRTWRLVVRGLGRPTGLTSDLATRSERGADSLGILLRLDWTDKE